MLYKHETETITSTHISHCSHADKPYARSEEQYRNPLVEELRLFTQDCLTTPTLELDQGETDEDEIHVLTDKKLKVGVWRVHEGEYYHFLSRVLLINQY